MPVRRPRPGMVSRTGLPVTLVLYAGRAPTLTCLFSLGLVLRSTRHVELRSPVLRGLGRAEHDAALHLSQPPRAGRSYESLFCEVL